MKISSSQIKEQTFSRKLKGYDPEEVHQFLSYLAEEFDLYLLKNEKLKDEIKSLKEKLEEYRIREKVLRETLIAAQKFAEELKENARKESELIVKEAEVKAEDIINRSAQEVRKLKDEIFSLKRIRKDFELKLLNYIDSVQHLIEIQRKEAEEGAKIDFLAKEKE
ncbi:MAG: DivIVA domain-containing protein [Candidatus Aminicenantia bacterium]